MCARRRWPQFPGANGKIAYGLAHGRIHCDLHRRAGRHRPGARWSVAERPDPSWSPDGRLAIAMSSVPLGDRARQRRRYGTDSDHERRRPSRTTRARTGHPDGTRLVASRFSSTSRGVEVGACIGADGSGERALAIGGHRPPGRPTDNGSPTRRERSTTGTSTRTGTRAWIFDIARSRPSKLGRVRARCRSPRGPTTSMPDWSPDGSQIAFTSRAAPTVSRTRISRRYVANADGTKPRFLTPACTPPGRPDGTRIAFSRAPFGRRSTRSGPWTDRRATVTSLDDGITRTRAGLATAAGAAARRLQERRQVLQGRAASSGVSRASASATAVARTRTASASARARPHARPRSPRPAH